MANLSEMSNEEREAYRRKVSETIGLDPELRLLDYIWMPGEDGMRNLVLYCRRGAAEILRAKLGISVTKLTKEVGDGEVSFTASGTDKSGRSEMAVGTSSVIGLRGEKLAHAVMTASTRALRRLTLQFTGHGLLDETEVQSQTADIASSPASLAQLSGSPAVIPPPTVSPSTVPGRDITATPAPQPVILPAISETPAPVTPAVAPVTPQTEAAKTAAISEPESKKKRTYKKRNQVSIASPGQEVPQAVSLEVPPPIQTRPLGPPVPPVVPPSVPPQMPPVSPSVDIPQSQPSPTPPFVQMPSISKEKQEGYRTRLAKYYVDVLPKGGMLPSEGIGGVTMKMRKFAAVFSGVQEVKQMTEQNWEDLFEFLDASTDPVALVKYINKALGVE